MIEMEHCDCCCTTMGDVCKVKINLYKCIEEIACMQDTMSKDSKNLDTMVTIQGKILERQ